MPNGKVFLSNPGQFVQQTHRTFHWDEVRWGNSLTMKWCPGVQIHDIPKVSRNWAKKVSKLEQIVTFCGGPKSLNRSYSSSVGGQKMMLPKTEGPTNALGILRQDGFPSAACNWVTNDLLRTRPKDRVLTLGDCYSDCLTFMMTFDQNFIINTQLTSLFCCPHKDSVGVVVWSSLPFLAAKILPCSGMPSLLLRQEIIFRSPGQMTEAVFHLFTDMFWFCMYKCFIKKRQKLQRKKNQREKERILFCCTRWSAQERVCIRQIFSHTSPLTRATG